MAYSPLSGISRLGATSPRYSYENPNFAPNVAVRDEGASMNAMFADQDKYDEARRADALRNLNAGEQTRQGELKIEALNTQAGELIKILNDESRKDQWPAAKRNFDAIAAQIEQLNAQTKFASEKARLAPTTTTVTGQKDLVKMGTLGEEIDAQQRLVIKALNEGKNTSDPAVVAAQEAISDLQSQYVVASQGGKFNSDVDDLYTKAVNATKATNDATKAGLDIGKAKSEITKGLLTDAQDIVGKWSQTNKTAVDNLVNAASYRAAYDKLAGLDSSPAQFASMVKMVLKMALPNEAVMGDDMKTMAQYGGGESSAMTTMIQGARQFAEVMSSAVTSISQAASSAAKAGVKEVKSLNPFGAKEAEAPVAQSKGPGIKQTLASAYGDAKGVIDSKYTAEVKNIMAVGKTFAEQFDINVAKLQGNFKTAIADNLMGYLQTSNGAAVKAATGMDVREFLGTPDGKQALDAAIGSATNNTFTSINQAAQANVPATPSASEAKTDSPIIDTTVEKPTAGLGTQNSASVLAANGLSGGKKSEKKATFDTDDAKAKLAREQAKAKADKKAKADAEAAKKAPKADVITYQTKKLGDGKTYKITYINGVPKSKELIK